MPQVITLQSQYNYNTKQILFLCQMTEQEYNDFIMEMAETWLNRMFGHLPDKEQLLGSVTFWKWFKMHWQDRDDRYFLDALYNTVESYRYVKYRQMHQCIFDKEGTVSNFLYNDFLDMYKTFSHETKI